MAFISLDTWPVTFLLLMRLRRKLSVPGSAAEAALNSE